MGASMSRYFASVEEAEQWAEQQTRLAARWNLQKAVDVTLPVVKVPVVRPDGTPAEVAVAVESPRTAEQRVTTYLSQTGRQKGYREDRTRWRQRGFIRSLRFE